MSVPDRKTRTKVSLWSLCWVWFVEYGFFLGRFGKWNSRERERVGLKRKESREEIPRQEEGGEDSSMTPL